MCDPRSIEERKPDIRVLRFISTTWKRVFQTGGAFPGNIAYYSMSAQCLLWNIFLILVDFVQIVVLLLLKEGNRSFRLQVVSPTGRFAYTEVDSPTQVKSIPLHK